METLSRRFSLVTDVETSGNDPDRFGVITCSALIVDERLNIVDSYSRLVKPPLLSHRTWQKEAEAVHKVPFEKVFYEGISNDLFCLEFLQFVGKYRPLSNDMPFICHASKNGMRRFKPGLGKERKDAGTWEIWPAFDWHFIERSMRKATFNDGTEMVWTFNKVFNFEKSFISTVNMARDAGYVGNRLNQWAERLRFDLSHHDAESDSKCCLEVYKFLLNKNEVESQGFSNDPNFKSEDIPF